MRRFFCMFTMTVLVLLFLVSCSERTWETDKPDHAEREGTSESVKIGERLCDKLGFPDQSKPPEYVWTNLSDTDDVEIKYDNIIVTLEKKAYSLNEGIRVYVENGNGKVYSRYEIPYLEKWDAVSNSWRRLGYAPTEAYYAQWHTCYKQTSMRFNPYFCSEELTAGQYRFIVFCGGKSFYSETFTLS